MKTNESLKACITVANQAARKLGHRIRYPWILGVSVCSKCNELIRLSTHSNTNHYILYIDEYYIAEMRAFEDDRTMQAIVTYYSSNATDSKRYCPKVAVML